MVSPEFDYLAFQTTVKWRIINDLSWPACLSESSRQTLLQIANWTCQTTFVTSILGSTWAVQVINGVITQACFTDAYLPFGLRSSQALFLKHEGSLATLMSTATYYGNILTTSGVYRGKFVEAQVL